MDIGEETAVAAPADLIWGLKLSLQSTPLDPFSFLPTDLQLLILHNLSLLERLQLRQSCRAARALTANPEGWATLAEIAWAAVQYQAGVHKSVYAHCGEATRLANATLHGATLADACSRMVAWPSFLTSELVLSVTTNEVSLALTPDATGSTALEFAALAALSVASSAVDATSAVLASSVAAAAAAITSPRGATTVRVSTSDGGRTVAFQLHHPHQAMLHIGTVLTDIPFPCVGSTGVDAPGSPPTAAPLPFCTPSDALGVPRGWALRLSAYYEVTLLTPPPPYGCFRLGLLDDGAANTIDELSRQTVASAPRASTLSDAAGTLLGTRRGGVFVAQRIRLDPSGDAFHLVELTWSGLTGDVRTRELSHSRVGTAAGKKPFDSGLARGDTIGVGIDHIAGVVFFTHNGFRHPQAEAEVSMLVGWRAALVATGPVALRVNLGVDSVGGSERRARRATAVAEPHSPPAPLAPPAAAAPPPPAAPLATPAAAPAVATRRQRDGSAGGSAAEAFHFDVLENEARRWSELVSSHSMKRIFADQQKQLARQMHHHQSGLTGSSTAVPSAHDHSSCQVVGGWPWSACGSWQHAIEAHLEPWLRMNATWQAEGVHRADGASSIVVPQGVLLPAAVPEHVCSPTAPRVGVRGLLPSGLRIFPSPDPLAVTAADRADLAAFARDRDLPLATAQLCAAAGLTLAHMDALQTAVLMGVARHAGMPTGQRLRLRHALSGTWGDPLGPQHMMNSPPRTKETLSGRRSIAAWLTARRRVVRYERVRSLVVMLSPCLPVRSYPSLRSPIVGFCGCGEVVAAIGECGAWIELQPRPRDPPARPLPKRAAHPTPRFWVLRDGHVAGQPSDLLRTAREGDAGAVAPLEGGSWHPPQQPRANPSATTGMQITAHSSDLPIFDTATGPRYVYSPPHAIPAGGTGTLQVVVAALEGSAKIQLVMFDPINHSSFWYAPEATDLTPGRNEATLGPNAKETYIRAVITVRSGTVAVSMLSVHGHVLHGDAAGWEAAATLPGRPGAPAIHLPDPYALDTAEGLYARVRPRALAATAAATAVALNKPPALSSERLWVYEGPRWSTTRSEGQGTRVSELVSLVHLAHVPAHRLQAMLAVGVSVPTLVEMPPSTANRLLRAAELPVLHRERLVAALSTWRQRARDLVQTDRARQEGARVHCTQANAQASMLERVEGVAEGEAEGEADNGLKVGLPQPSMRSLESMPTLKPSTLEGGQASEVAVEMPSDDDDDDGDDDDDDDVESVGNWNDAEAMWLAAWWPVTWRDMESSRPPSSALAAALARTGVPDEEAAAFALRLLAHGVSVHDVKGWAARGRRILTAELPRALQQAGVTIGSRQRLLKHLARRRTVNLSRV